MNDEIFSVGGTRGKPFSNMGQGLFVDPGDPHFEGIFALKEPRPWAVQPILVIRGLYCGSLLNARKKKFSPITTSLDQFQQM